MLASWNDYQLGQLLEHGLSYQECRRDEGWTRPDEWSHQNTPVITMTRRHPCAGVGRASSFYFAFMTLLRPLFFASYRALSALSKTANGVSSLY